jgi:hypothetical protein
MEKVIQHHNQMMMMSVLATFLQLGTGDTGSFALSADQSSFFLDSLGDYATYFCEQMFKQVIKRLVDLNFGKQEIYPILDFIPLGNINFVQFSQAIGNLVNAQAVKIDSKMIQWIHRMFKMPEISKETLEIMQEQEAEKELSALEQKTTDDMPMPEGEEKSGGLDQRDGMEDDKEQDQDKNNNGGTSTAKVSPNEY